MRPRTIERAIRRRLENAARKALGLGVPPSWFGYRAVQRETLDEYFERHSGHALPGAREVIHEETFARNPLPQNIGSAAELPDERGWWGFSFRDVPSRKSGRTVIARLPECRVMWYRDPTRDDDFYPAILTHDDHALDLREVRFRPRHARVLRRAGGAARVEHATWILERVYHNHSHWLTAHLPKLLLLREQGGLDDALLPSERTSTMNGSLRMLDLDPNGFPTFDRSLPIESSVLTIVQNDRFRPELLQMVRDAFGAPGRAEPRRRVFVSRTAAARRRLVNEDEIWPLFAAAGFERVLMETMSLEEQVALMHETSVLAGPHGAGLTNMIFCPPGTHVVEIADLSFPNPNFYALAAGLDHHYWILEGKTSGEGHPLERDFGIDPAAVRQVLSRLQ